MNQRDQSQRTGPFAPYRPSVPWGAIGLGLLAGGIILWVMR